jgi:ribosome-associated protein
MLKITDTLAIREAEFRERFVRASGPGGQNVNKVATAVQLTFDVSQSSLPDEIKMRLLSIAGRSLSADGVLRIDSRAFRTQAQNREAARKRLAALIQRAAKRPKRRRATRVPKKATEYRLQAKKQRGELKQRRHTPIDD